MDIFKNLPYHSLLRMSFLPVFRWETQVFQREEKSFVNGNPSLSLHLFCYGLGSGQKTEKSLSFLKVFQKNSKSFRTRNNDYPQERTHRKMLPTKIEQKFMATLSKGNRRIYKVLLREAAPAKSKQFESHTSHNSLSSIPLYSHLWTMIVPGNRTGIENTVFQGSTHQIWCLSLFIKIYYYLSALRNHPSTRSSRFITAFNPENAPILETRCLWPTNQYY